MNGLFLGPDGWRLAPEGAAVRVEEKTAIIADVHLGYEWARGQGGDSLPAHSLRETLAKLETLFARTEIRRLVVAGDLVESRHPCHRTSRDLTCLKAWLHERNVEFLALAGNHDPPRRPALPETITIAGWTVAHGHRELPEGRTISGHHHPVLKARGLFATCFLADPDFIVLPAFSPNAAGACVWSLPQALGQPHARCLAVAGEELLDFGPANALPEALKALTALDGAGPRARNHPRTGVDAATS